MQITNIYYQPFHSQIPMWCGQVKHFYNIQKEMIVSFLEGFDGASSHTVLHDSQKRSWMMGVYHLLTRFLGDVQEILKHHMKGNYPDCLGKEEILASWPWKS